MARGRRHQSAGHLFLGAMATLLAGCPYDADIEPRGQPPSLRNTVVGTWVCDLDEDASWADLSVGWTQESTYLLTVRIRRPEKEQPTGPWELRARPLWVGHQEVWSLSGQDANADAPVGNHLFLRLEGTRPDALRLGVLGGTEPCEAVDHLHIPSQERKEADCAAKSRPRTKPLNLTSGAA